MVWPSGAKRAARMLPRRKVSWRYTGGSIGAEAKNFFPAYSPAAAATSNPIAKISVAEDFLRCAGTCADATAAAAAEDERSSAASASLTTEVREESRERLRRLRSARSSAADWQRMSGSFSKALLMISSSLGG